MLLKISLLSLLFNFLGCQKPPPSPKVEYYQFNLITKRTIQNNKKIDLRLQAIITTDSINNHRGSIEEIADATNNSAKKSYEVDLINDVPLGNLPADDDWILDASNLDKSFMRNVFVYDLFRTMNYNNKAAQSKYVELQFNNKYHGLYILTEKLDKSSLQIDDKDEKAIIFKNPPIFTTKDFVPEDSTNYFQQVFPKKKKKDNDAFIAGVKNFINYSENEVFSEEVATIFDVNNIIDWHLLLLLTNNEGGFLKNFYLYKVDELTPLRIAPWNYENALKSESNSTHPLVVEKSILLNRLIALDWYKTAIKKRWADLNANGLFSINALHQRIGNYQSVLRELIPKNYEKWEGGTNQNEFEKEVNSIKNYLSTQHKALSKYFDVLE